jgi:hypothetical protein
MPKDVTEKTCPLGHTCATCLWHVHLYGQHPQTGALLDNWGCAIAYLPVLLVEGSQQTKQAAAAIESFRNEMVEANGETAARLREVLVPLVGPARERLPDPSG